MNLDEMKTRLVDLVTHTAMVNVKPKESEGQTEGEKPASAKPSNDIKPEEAKGNKGYVDEFDRPPSPKLSNDIKHSHSEETEATLTYVSNQIAYTSQSKEILILKSPLRPRRCNLTHRPMQIHHIHHLF